MRVVVTGGAGFIGSALSAALVDRGDEVVVVDDLSSGKRERVPEKATLIVADIRERDALLDAFGDAEVVFHQAALRSVPRSLDEPMLVHEVNGTGTLNVLLCAEESGTRRVVYASSSSVYGGAQDGKSVEDAAPNPLSPYAVSKLIGECYCNVWATLGRVSTISLRYFNVFGPGQSADSRYAAVFPAFISALQRGEAPEIHWDGEQSRDFTFIDDVVRANLLAASPESVADGQVVNIAGGTPRTINDVYRAVCEALDADVEPRRVSKRSGDIRHSYADRTRAERLLSWQPLVPWNDAVLATVEWFRTRLAPASRE